MNADLVIIKCFGLSLSNFGGLFLFSCILHFKVLNLQNETKDSKELCQHEWQDYAMGLRAD